MISVKLVYSGHVGVDISWRQLWVFVLASREKKRVIFAFGTRVFRVQCEMLTSQCEMLTSQTICQRPYRVHFAHTWSRVVVAIDRYLISRKARLWTIWVSFYHGFCLLAALLFYFALLFYSDPCVVLYCSLVLLYVDPVYCWRISNLVGMVIMIMNLHVYFLSFVLWAWSK